jgi:hypothetical protein
VYEKLERMDGNGDGEGGHPVNQKELHEALVSGGHFYKGDATQI